MVINVHNKKFARFVSILFDFSPLGDSYFQNRLRFPISVISVISCVPLVASVLRPSAV